MSKDDSLQRAQRGASRIGRGLTTLLTSKSKPKPTPTRRPRRRRKVKSTISGSDNYRTYLKKRLKE